MLIEEKLTFQSSEIWYIKLWIQKTNDNKVTLPNKELS